MNEQLMFVRVKQLCIASGKGIDSIAKECGINQNIVAKLFMKTMEHALGETEKGAGNVSD